MLAGSGFISRSLPHMKITMVLEESGYGHDSSTHTQLKMFAGVAALLGCINHVREIRASNSSGKEKTIQSLSVEQKNRGSGWRSAVVCM